MNKKQLYETIMFNVSKQVRKALNEELDITDDPYEITDDDNFEESIGYNDYNIAERLLTAINEGVYKALQINDQDDKPVNYSHNKIVNNMDIMPHLVNDFLNNTEDDSIFQDILNIYTKDYKRYKVKNIDELLKIYERINIASRMSGYPFDMNWIDTTNAMTFIMNNGEEKPIFDVNKDSKYDIAFIKLKNDNTDDIYLKINQLQELQWADSNAENIHIYNDKNSCGYEHTKYWLNNISDIEHYPALKEANQIISVDNVNYQGYIPTYDELTFTLRYWLLINFSINHIQRPMIFTGSFDIWTCEESQISKGLMYICNVQNPRIIVTGKSSEIYTLILYKKEGD